MLLDVSLNQHMQRCPSRVANNGCFIKYTSAHIRNLNWIFFFSSAITQAFQRAEGHTVCDFVKEKCNVQNEHEDKFHKTGLCVLRHSEPLKQSDHRCTALCRVLCKIGGCCPFKRMEWKDHSLNIL